MKREVVSLVVIILLLGLVSAVASENMRIGGDKDENGCLTAAGYSWNASESKCVKEWENGTDRYQDEVPEDEALEEIQDNGLGQEIRNRVRAGVYTNENGEQIRVSELAKNRIRLRVNETDADCDCNLTEEKIQNRTRLKMHLRNGSEVNIKIMPNVASERALERLGLKVCTEEENCSIILKEVGEGNKTRAAYEMQVQRHFRILGMFKAKAEVRAQLDAESGEIIKIHKPWWSFLAAESEE